MKSSGRLLLFCGLVSVCVTLKEPFISAQPVGPGPGGSYYEVVISGQITWGDARARAKVMSYRGRVGDLATITSRDENEYIGALFSQDECQPETAHEFWIGGFQNPNANQLGEGWQWLNDEGDIASTNDENPFTNWDCRTPRGCGTSGCEPNDVDLTLCEEDGEEQSLGFWCDTHTWNDEKDTSSNIMGFIVEYEFRSFLRGDANVDGSRDVSDAIFMLNYLFGGTFKAQPKCLEALDANDDGLLDDPPNVADPIYLLNFLFGGGPPPPPPHVDCGVDTQAGLGCESFPPCE